MWVAIAVLAVILAVVWYRREMAFQRALDRVNEAEDAKYEALHEMQEALGIKHNDWWETDDEWDDLLENPDDLVWALDALVFGPYQYQYDAAEALMTAVRNYQEADAQYFEATQRLPIRILENAMPRWLYRWYIEFRVRAFA